MVFCPTVSSASNPSTLPAPVAGTTFGGRAGALPDLPGDLGGTDELKAMIRRLARALRSTKCEVVTLYQEEKPLFSKFQIEDQIASIFENWVPLTSGGSIVIAPTEALVAIDVNSGKSTHEKSVEQTAFQTNLEAAEEIARQLRLRDLGGLIVIDFIDMENPRAQREVENRLRDALHYDRARVQTGKISRFGLLELSRQRLRPALAEMTYIPCPRCTGTGHIRSTESAALHILRILEEEAMKENTGALHVQVPVDVGTFLLNEKRIDIARIEARHRVNLLIIPNRHLETPQHEIIRLRHDQLNLEGTALASYEMAVKPAEEENSPAAAGEARAPRAEAAVKGITPDQPAPTVAPKEPEAPPPAPGLFSRIMSWLTGGGKKEEVVEEAPKKPARPARRERGEGERGDRGGRGRREGRDRNERGDRGERTERGDRGERRDRGSETAGKEPREGREGKEGREGRQGGRKERGERGGDNRRDNRGTEAQEANARPDNRQNRQKPASETEPQAMVSNAAPAEGNAQDAA